MLFNTADRCLYIFGGQRKRDEYLNDFLTFNVDTELVRFLTDGSSNRSELACESLTNGPSYSYYFLMAMYWGKCI
jgi:hypothetical protein